MTCSLRESLHLVSDPKNLDASVEEVFRMMLGVNCLRYYGAGGDRRAGVGDRGGGFWRPIERSLCLPQRGLGGHQDRYAHDRHEIRGN